MSYARLLLVWPQLSLLAVLLLTALASAYLAVQLGLRQERPAVPLRPGEADFYASGVHLLHYQNDGTVSIQMRAERLEHIPSEQGLALIAPVFWISTDNGGTMLASALRAVGKDDLETAQLEGEVRLVRRTSSGETLKIQSELAMIGAGGAQIRMPGRARIEQGGAYLEGENLLADELRKTLSLGPRVSAVFPASPKTTAAMSPLQEARRDEPAPMSPLR